MAFIPAALFLNGCDKQSSATPQPKAEEKAETEALSGEIAKPGPEVSGVLDRSHKGAAMPAILFEDPHGAAVSLTTFKGKPLLVNLWATWCGPCVAEMPTLDDLAGTHAANLQLIVVSQDIQGRAQVDPWWAKHDFKHLRPYVDPKASLSTAFGDGTLPTTIMFDADGRELWRTVGAMDWTGQEAVSLIREAAAG